MRGIKLSVVPLALLVGCRAAAPETETGATASAEPRASAAAIIEPTLRERPPTRRGLGSLKARVPGTNDVVGNVTLVSHKVTAVVRDGFARTEVEEVFRNDNDRVLEGIFTFALPASGAITRLALDVDGKLVEGELEEQKRAAGIFRGIVDDTVRPRDPALLQQRGGKVELKIFPMPAKGTRRVIVAYDEVLPERGGKGTYTLPLSAGKERESKIDEVLATVSIEGATKVTSDDPVSGADNARRVVREARDVAPQSDLVVAYERPPTSVSSYTPRPGEAGASKGETASGFVTARLQVPDSPATATSGPRVFVVDVGHGQPAEALADAWDIIDTALARAPEGSQFAVLACDSACVGFPETGLSTTNATSRAAFSRWSSDLSSSGASDVAGMLIDGARRATERGTLVLLGRGTATAGELSPSGVVSRVKAASIVPEIVHVIGVGPFADEPSLRAVAQGLGASVARARGGDAARHATRLLAPVLRAPTLSLPPGLSLVAPDPLPSLVAGDEIVLSARAAAEAQGDIVVEGSMSGTRVRIAQTVDATRRADNPLLEKLWARDRISSLSALGDPALDKEIVKLSKSFHVLSPKTAFIVLENEAMFAAFGIQRTSRRADDQADQSFGAGQGTSGGSAPGSAQGVGHGAAATSEPAASPGLGGLGLSGAGGVAAPRGGLGDIGTLDSIGTGSGRVGSASRSLSAQVRMGAMTVNGGLPREVVQRIVRQNFGRFRQCAERGLQVDPGAVGTVTLRFVISTQGTVASVAAPSVSGVSAQTGQCMSATLRLLSFPESERGPVQVSFPVIVTLDERPRAQPQFAYQAPSPTVTVVAGGDAWMTGGDDEITKLTLARDQSPEKRRAHETLMLALSRRGRDGVAAGRAWALADPDEARAHGFLAEALSRAGSDAEAARELGVVAALDPTNQAAQLAAARAYLAVGDARRTCAHLRTAALAPDATTPVRVEALRCRLDVLGDASARDEARSLAEKIPQLKALAEGTKADALDLGVPGALKFDVKCDSCPPIVIVAPNGRVLGASAPSKSVASKHHVESSLSMSGIFRVIFAGPPPAEGVDLVVTTLHGRQTIKVPANTKTLAAVNVELPMAGFGIGIGR